MGAEFNCNYNDNFAYATWQPRDMVETSMKELLANLMKKIDKALENRDERTFNRLLKQYKYLSMEI